MTDAASWQLPSIACRRKRSIAERSPLASCMHAMYAFQSLQQRRAPALLRLPTPSTHNCAGSDVPRMSHVRPTSLSQGTSALLCAKQLQRTCVLCAVARSPSPLAQHTTGTTCTAQMSAKMSSSIDSTSSQERCSYMQRSAKPGAASSQDLACAACVPARVGGGRAGTKGAACTNADIAAVTSCCAPACVVSADTWGAACRSMRAKGDHACPECMPAWPGAWVSPRACSAIPARKQL